MTPQKLAAALNARRRDLGLVWWQVCVELDISEDTIARMRRGVISGAVRERVTAWLDQGRLRDPTGTE